MLADVKLAGDELVGEPPAEEIQHLALARGQRFGELIDGGRRLPQQPLCQGLLEQDQTPRGRRDRDRELLRRGVRRHDSPAFERQGAQPGYHVVLLGDNDERLRAVLGDGDSRLIEQFLVHQEDHVGLGERESGGRGGLAHHPHTDLLGVREHRAQPRPGHRCRGHDECSRRHATRPGAPRFKSMNEILPPRMTRRRTASPARAMASGRDSASCDAPSSRPSRTSPTSRPALPAAPSTAAIMSPVSGTPGFARRKEVGSSTGSTRTPRRGRCSSPASQASAALLGIESARRPKIMALIPTISPLALRSGPPEFPGARATSDWMYRVLPPGLRTTPRPLTMPAVTAPSRPHGWPMAYTSSPTRKVSESPTGAAGRSPSSTWSSARSRFLSRFKISASSVRPSCRTTRTLPPRLRDPSCAPAPRSRESARSSPRSPTRPSPRTPQPSRRSPSRARRRLSAASGACPRAPPGSEPAGRPSRPSAVPANPRYLRLAGRRASPGCRL